MQEAAELVIRVIFGLPLCCAAEGKAKKLWRSISKGRDVRGNRAQDEGDSGSQRGAGKGKLLKTQEEPNLSVLSCCLAQLENWRLSIYSVEACFLGRDISSQRNLKEVVVTL